jgi:hypothetical protein
MNLKMFPVMALGLSLFVTPALASEKYDHFKGLPAENLEQALENLASHNEKLAAVIANEKLTPAQMHEVHQLTYTLENAMKRLEDEVERLSEVLETVHEASEHADPAAVKREGQVYLRGTNQLVGRGN